VNALLTVSGLHVHFDTPAGTVHANNGVSLEVRRGESLGIMGESGCGKTVLFLSLLHLQQPGRIVGGQVLLDGRANTNLDEREMRHVRGRQVALVPQNQATALNPAYTVRQQLAEALRVRRGGGGSGPEAEEEFARVFGALGFETRPTLDLLLRSYPHQLSGGMRQRVLIAMALLMQPRLLIADEPTTALDRAVKGQTLDALQQMRGSLTMLVVSHDVDAIAAACDRVAVMYGGRIVETGPCAAVLNHPHHPYSRLLLAAQRRARGERLPADSPEGLDLINFPSGCAFHPACPDALHVCRVEPPSEWELSCGVTVACHLYRETSR